MFSLRFINPNSAIRQSKKQFGTGVYVNNIDVTFTLCTNLAEHLLQLYNTYNRCELKPYYSPYHPSLDIM